MSAAEKRAYIIADNKLADKAGWDREILAIELPSLVKLEFDMSLTCFETAEPDLIFEEAEECNDALAREETPPVYDGRRRRHGP